jgi:hypothetical protein
MIAPSSTLPAPAVSTAPVRGKWQREYDAFLRLKVQLLASHAGQYVLIHNGQIQASGSDEVALALQFFADHGNVPIHIGRVVPGPEPAARIPHYREGTAPFQPSY